MAKPKPLILIVEDEKELAAVISENLEMAGMMTQTCHKASLALRYLQKNFVNLMLLDVHLPDMTGFDLLEEMKRLNLSVPVIFLTGSHSEVNKVKGLELGGDDYVTKPFSFPELIARIHAVLRRAETSRDFHITKNASLAQEPFDFCGARILPDRLEIVFPSGTVTKMGRKELGIMTFLVQNKGSIVTRRSLIHSVWGIHADVRSRSLDQYMVKIRDYYHEAQCGTPVEKSNKEGGTEVYYELKGLETIHGVGYRYDPDGSAAPANLAEIAAALAAQEAAEEREHPKA